MPGRSDKGAYRGAADAAPTYVEYGDFTGLNTVADPLRLAEGELTRAANVVIDNTRMVHRRRGFKKITAGRFHSLWSDGTLCLAVHDGDLVGLSPANGAPEDRAGTGACPYNELLTETVLLRGAGEGRMSYAAVPGGRVYFCNGSVNGYVSGGAARPIPPVDAGVCMKFPLPVGNLVEFFRGRLYTASGNVLYISDAGVPDRVDYSGFRHFGGKLAMVRAVDDGIYVSDDSATYWMGGLQPEEAALVKVADYPAIPYTDVVLGYGYSTGDNDKPISARAAMWHSARGICLGRNGGVLENLTMFRHEIGYMNTGAAIHVTGSEAHNEARGGNNYYICTIFESMQRGS